MIAKLRIRSEQPRTYPACREQGNHIPDAGKMVDPSQPLVLEIPLRIHSELNRQQGKRATWAFYARKKHQRNSVAAHLAQHRGWLDRAANRGAPKLVVTLTRIGTRKLDGDNLASGFKAVRDAIAQAFCIDDGSDRWTWQYDQRIGEYGCEIRIEAEFR